MEELARDLVAWIRDQVIRAGARGVVFGLSGGVDSAVVGALCRKACPDHCLALILPCHTSEVEVRHAELVARTFDLEYRLIRLDGVYDLLVEAFNGTLSRSFPPDTLRLALGNIKPRLRMLVLYFYANLRNYLVVGTGNRSELAVGYFTKYGDGGVDILPLGNLVKRQVRELASFLGVPEEIIKKPPSAGLWEGQTDEGELGITYELLDAYLLSGGVPPEVKEKIEAMKKRSEHKRRMPLIPEF